MTEIEFFFDISSPYTYLAFLNIQPMATEFGARLTWRPILVGGIFNTINPSVYASRENPVPAKQAYMLKDLQDSARIAGIRLKFPPSIFPVNSVRAMRGFIALEDEGKLVPFAKACFEAYWGEDRDIADDVVLREICRSVGVDAEALLRRIAEPAVKDALRQNTEELMRRGGFGSPTLFVDGSDMYFGNDRLPTLRHALEASRVVAPA